uniref:Uncharacterized protein n=1 Tax=Arundo donax TaxID=35708 RepID=A0A0A9FJQ3_ARUDO
MYFNSEGMHMCFAYPCEVHMVAGSSIQYS